MDNILEKISKVNYRFLALVGIVVAPIIAFCPRIFDSFDFAKIVWLSLFCVVALAFLIWGKDEEALIVKAFRSDALVLVFLFIALVSTYLSQDKTLSLFGGFGAVSQWDLGVIGRFSSGFLALGLFCVVYLIFSRSTGNSMSIKKFFSLVLFSQAICLIVFYLALFGFFDSQRLSFLPNLFKGFAPFLNTFSPINRIVIPFSVFSAIVSGISLWVMAQYGDLDAKLKYLAISTLVLPAPVFYLAKFFPANLILIFSGIILLFSAPPKKSLIRAIAVALIFCSLVLALPQSSELIYRNFKANVAGEIVLPLDKSLAVAVASASASAKNFFLGSGIGTYSINYLLYRGEQIIKEPYWSIRFQESGSYVAEILGTMGFFGLISFIGCCLYFIYLGYKRRDDDSEAFGLAIFIAVIVFSLFVYHINIWQMSLLFVSFGLMARQAERSFSVNKGLSYIPLIYVLVLFFFLVNFAIADSAYLNALGAMDKEKLSSNIANASGGNKYSELYRQGMVRYYYSELSEKVKTVDLAKDKEVISEAVVLVDSQITRNIEMFPNRVSVWESKGAFYRELLPFEPKALGPAIAAFEKAKSFDPNNPILLTEIGTLYLAAGEVDKADENVSKAVILRPDYMPAILQRALIMEKRDKITDAIVLLESALNSYPQTGVDVAFQLGRLYYRAKKFTDAKAVFESVVNIVPNHSDSLFLLGEISRQSGNRGEANKYFQKVLDLNPGNPEVLKAMREESTANQTTTKSK